MQSGNRALLIGAAVVVALILIFICASLTIFSTGNTPLPGTLPGSPATTLPGTTPAP